MRISDWRSDVCSSDLRRIRHRAEAEADIVGVLRALEIELIDESRRASLCARLGLLDLPAPAARGGDDAVEQVERRGLRVTRAELADDPFGMDVDPHFGRDALGKLVETQPGELLAVSSEEQT